MSTKVAVIGVGYVGLVTAACMAELGHRVAAFDHDPGLIRELESGVVRIHEPELPALVRKHLASGRLRFAPEFTSTESDVAVAIITVGTPPGYDGRPDLDAVFGAVRAVIRHAPQAVICLKSTVPPGASKAVAAEVRRLGARSHVVVNPEFLSEGHAVRDFMQADRIVVGADEEPAGALVAGLYSRIRAPLVRCTCVEAELAKYASNALLASRISFINEISEVADAVGADIAAVSAVVGMDRRIGPSFLRSGLGWGGSCFPKDVRGLARLAQDLGCSSAMLDASMIANDRQLRRAATIASSLASDRANPTVAVLGLAFKPGTNDIRESPALHLIRELLAGGCTVRATDPAAREAAAAALPNLVCAADPYQAADGADVVVLATDWPEYRTLDWTAMRTVMRGHAVLDARNALDARAIETAGLTYRSLGRDASRNASDRDVLAAER